MGCNKPEPAPLHTANFYVENNGCIAPCNLIFYDNSENAVQWKWTFGNGISSVKKNDTVLFSSSGTYETWLYIWNADQVKDSLHKTIQVN